jgi:hypothetical protein
MLSNIVSLEPRVRSRPSGGCWYLLYVVLRNGRAGEVDVSHILTGPAFGHLKDPERFCEVKLDPEWHAPVWPNGADICPDVIEALLDEARP